MKLIDARCKSCATIRRDTLQRDSGAIEPCRACGADMERLAISEGQSAPPNVSPDDIPGGYVVHHGICNEDGTPRRYYSYSEMEREAKKRGLVQMVEHVPPEDTDKSEHTQRFVGLPASLSAEDEAARVAAWWADERAQGFAPPAPPEKPKGITMGANRDPHGATKQIIKAHL